MRRSIKRKLLRAKIALNTTISRILDINRKRKKLQLYEEIPIKEEELYDELKSRGVDVIAAYRLDNNQCGCCGVDLTTSELDLIFSTEFQQCPYCGGILV